MQTGSQPLAIVLAPPALAWQPVALVLAGLAMQLAGLWRGRRLPVLSGFASCEAGAWLDGDLVVAIGNLIALAAILLLQNAGQRGVTQKNNLQTGHSQNG